MQAGGYNRQAFLQIAPWQPLTPKSNPSLIEPVPARPLTACAARRRRYVSIELDHPRDAAHGDYACSVAMKLAKSLRRNPRELAALIQAALPASPLVEKTEIAGAGFINVFLKPAAYQQIVPQIFAQGDAFGNGRIGTGKKVQVEFVSANPDRPATRRPWPRCGVRCQPVQCAGRRRL